MKILVTGSKGQLGQSFREVSVSYNNYQFLFTDKEELDITDERAVKQYFKKNKPDCVINCAGYTDVDRAEQEMAEAKLQNARGAAVLSEAAAGIKALMIQISTDYVFDGKSHRPYTEHDSACPRSVYGKTKLDGEVEVILNSTRSVIIRTSWLYAPYGHNFVKTILQKARTEKELRVVCDQIGAPTYAPDLAKAVCDMLPAIPSKIRGEIYHYSNEGVCSWYDLAKAIADIKGLDCDIAPVMSKEYKTAAARPHYSVLDKSRIKKEYRLKIPYWRDGLYRCLERL